MIAKVAGKASPLDLHGFHLSVFLRSRISCQSSTTMIWGQYTIDYLIRLIASLALSSTGFFENNSELNYNGFQNMKVVVFVSIGTSSD